MSDYNFNFSTKEEYLDWRNQWKEKYKEISKLSRESKQGRKKFIWKYRDPGLTTVKKRTKVGENPNYDPHISYQVDIYRRAAKALLKQLKAAKIEANRLYLKKKVEGIAA